MHFKVIFNLDGCGIYYDQNEPIHLDALLAYALAPMQTKRHYIERGDEPDDIQLPLLRSTIQGHKIWHASALFLDSRDHETLRFWRKKFRTNRLHLTKGSPNLQMGIYREYNVPVPLMLIPRLIAYASGDCRETRRILQKSIKSLGKKRAYGYGKITSIETEETPEDFSIVKDGVSMRWLPHANGIRQVRVCPPYWNQVNTVNCCEIGIEYEPY